MITNYTLILILDGILFVIIYFLSLFMNRFLMKANSDVYEAGSPLFFILLAPGVIIHELSHALICKLLGVWIYEFKPLTFERRGNVVVYGYVKRESTEDPLKEALISTAPIYVGLIILAIIAMLPFFSNIGSPLWDNFKYLFKIETEAINSKPLNVMGSVLQSILAVWVDNRLINPIFWVIPYLSLTIMLSSRPSIDDLELAFRGLIYLLFAYIIIVTVSIFTPLIRFILFGVFEFLYVFLSLILALSIAGSVFLAILYFTFRIESYLKILPFIVAILIDLAIYPILHTPLSTIVSLITLVATLNMIYLVTG